MNLTHTATKARNLGRYGARRTITAAKNAHEVGRLLWAMPPARTYLFSTVAAVGISMTQTTLMGGRSKMFSPSANLRVIRDYPHLMLAGLAVLYLNQTSGHDLVELFHLIGEDAVGLFEDEQPGSSLDSIYTLGIKPDQAEGTA